MNSLEETALEVAQKMDDVFLRNVPADVLRSYARRLVATLGAQESVAIFAGFTGSVPCFGKFPDQLNIGTKLFAAPVLPVPQEPTVWWASMWKIDKGPNPFHTCKLCGETEPGLVEYLEAHSNKHITPVLPSVKEGWQMVPKKATPEMWLAIDSATEVEDAEADCHQIWSAMLAAAPSPQEDAK